MFLHRSTRALILALVTILLVVGSVQALFVGMAIAVGGESELGLGDYFRWLWPPWRWGLLWVGVALAYPAVVAVLAHVDLRRSVPVTAFVLYTSAMLAGMTGQHGGCVIVGVLPAVGLGAMIWCARRWGKPPARQAAAEPTSGGEWAG
jgi:hypothetical protein